MAIHKGTWVGMPATKGPAACWDGDDSSGRSEGKWKAGMTVIIVFSAANDETWHMFMLFVEVDGMMKMLLSGKESGEERDTN